jgi:hypothetical protein
MEESDFIWGGVFLVGAAVEVWALKNSIPGDTLSERTRKWFRVDTRTGKVVFTLGWLSFSAWFLNHVLS